MITYINILNKIKLTYLQKKTILIINNNNNFYNFLNILLNINYIQNFYIEKDKIFIYLYKYLKKNFKIYNKKVYKFNTKLFSISNKKNINIYYIYFQDNNFIYNYNLLNSNKKTTLLCVIF